MAYLICCEYAAHPPADGYSTARGTASPVLILTLRLGVAPIPLAWVLSPSLDASDAYCCNPWMAVTFNKITALFPAAQTLALALIGSLQSLSYTHHTSLDLEWSKWTPSFHVSALKTKVSTANTFPDNKEHEYFFKIRDIRIFIHCINTSVDLRTFIFGIQTVPKINNEILRPH